MVTPAKELPNSEAAIGRRVAAGRVSWTGPLILVLARPMLALAAQWLAVAVMRLVGVPDPRQEVTAWWTVYGNLVDAGCIALMVFFLRREGIRLFDLLSLDRGRMGKDTLLGVGLLIAVFPLSMLVGNSIASLVVYGSLQPELPAGAFIRELPLWAVLFSRMVWWIIWSVTEELTYNGYALPRLKVLSGRAWVAVLLVSLGWSGQHSFLPFINARHAMWLFLAFWPLTIAMQAAYLRMRRLWPLIIAHWAMDLGSVLFLVVAR